LDFAKLLKEQGFDFDEYFDNFQDIMPKNEWRYDTHVVNLAMSLKSGALYSAIDGSDPDVFAEKALNTLMKYHSMAAFHFTGDECLAGDSPIRGSELCGVVEAMYSYEQLLIYSQNVKWGDLLERLAFNALPTAVSEDMWTHQYDQMTNQPECSIMPEDKVVFATNNGEAHLYGLEPNYGCCTANFGQGFPKLTLSAYMRSEDGLVSTALLPSEVNFRIGDSKINCVCETEYPFGTTIQYIIVSDKPTSFTFSIRIPAFAKSAVINGKKVETGKYHRIKKTWGNKERVNISLEFEEELIGRPSGLYCLVRGPLLYALPVKDSKVMHEYEKDGVIRKFPYCDYELFPVSDWNYCFASDKFVFVESEISAVPFSSEKPPVYAEATMSKVDWEIKDGVCSEKPKSTKALSEPEIKRLIPYGCTNLRMTELPLCKMQNKII